MPDALPILVLFLICVLFVHFVMPGVANTVMPDPSAGRMFLIHLPILAWSIPAILAFVWEFSVQSTST